MPPGATPHGASPAAPGHAAEPQIRNTMIHVAEALAEVPYRTTGTAYVLKDGHPAHVEYEETDSCTRNFQLLDEWLSERGLQRKGLVGHAQARLARARDIIATAVPKLQQHPLTFLCTDVAGCPTCMAARKAAA